MNKKQVQSWLKKYQIKSYKINEDLTVDVKGDVNLVKKDLKSIDVQFNIVNGNFNCSFNLLTSLKGCPKEVTGDFNCSFNQLTNLDDCPLIVGGNFWCTYNKLTNLKCNTSFVGFDFFCSNNLIDTLEFGPSIIHGGLIMSDNPIKSLLPFGINIKEYFLYKGKTKFKELENFYHNELLEIHIDKLKTILLSNKLDIQLSEKLIYIKKNKV